MNTGPECAMCGFIVFDDELDEMVSDLNEVSQYHKYCWEKTGRVAWKVTYKFGDFRSDETKGR